MSMNGGSLHRGRRPNLLPRHITGKQHLPQPRGQYSVGYVDVMTSGDPKSGSFIRIYYPTEEHCLDEHVRWPTWSFEDKYVTGIFGFIQAMMHNWPSWAPRGEYLFVDKLQHVAKLIPHFGFSAVFKILFGHVHSPVIENAKVKKDAKWPLIIFSHGIGCSRFMYSQVCYDLASFGFIVASVEHREGSACMSRYYEDPDDDDGEPVVKWIPHYVCELEEDEYVLRNRQVHHRAGEATRALDLMIALANGDQVVNVFSKIPWHQPNNGHRGKNWKAMDGSGVECSSAVLHQFKGVVDVDNPVMCGHSFGGATTLLALSRDSRFKIGIALDSWLFPIRDEEFASNLTQPILFINTESFLNKKNLEKMASFEEGSAERKCYYIRGSVHQNHIDVPFLIQHKVIKRLLGMHSDTCPDRVMSLNNKMMVQFILKHLRQQSDDDLDAEIAADADLLHEGFECFKYAPEVD